MNACLVNIIIMGGGGGDTTEIFKFIQFSTFLNPIITHTVQLFKVATG